MAKALQREKHKKPNVKEACKHFNDNGHTFIKHVKFTIIKQQWNINTTLHPRKHLN